MPKIFLEGTHNTRDIGEIINKYGKVLQSNKLFRSDKLSELTKNDIKKVKELGIERIIDFRSEKEKSREPNVIIKDIEYIELSINADKNINKELIPVLRNESNKVINSFLIEANRDFVNIYSNIFKKFVKLIINEPKPTLFHCTAGKDRTGFATLLILYLCDVNLDVIITDYLRTNEYIKDSIPYQIENVSRIYNIEPQHRERIIPLLTVNKDYINAALTEIYKKYDSIDNYLVDELSISEMDKTKLQNYLLY